VTVGLLNNAGDINPARLKINDEEHNVPHQIFAREDFDAEEIGCRYSSPMFASGIFPMTFLCFEAGRYTRNRSRAERFGAHRRDRLTIRSCCFVMRHSARRMLAPPGPKGLAVVASGCAISSSRSFLLKKGIEGPLWNKTVWIAHFKRQSAIRDTQLSFGTIQRCYAKRDPLWL
jgi:hypothetical protein